MAFKAITLIVNTSKPQANDQARKLIDWLKKRNFSIKLAKEDASYLKCDNHACNDDELLKNTDLIITLGGDGTVLRAISLLQGKEIPILAVNYGKFGFLQEIDPSTLYSDLKVVLSGKYHEEQRNLLEVKFENKKYLMLNDLVLGHDGNRIMHIKTYINDTFFYEYAADGLAVANPTGATAYSFSAGGPLVNPQAKVNVLTPINPHSLLNRSLVLDENDIIRTEIASINGNLKISADGLLVYQGSPVDAYITGSRKKANFLRLGPTDYFGFLRKKLVVLCGVNGVD